MKIFVTKYALTVGIKEMEGQDEDKDKGYIWSGPPERMSSQMLSGGEWFLTRAEAVVNARKRILAKLRSIKKQTDKLHELDVALAEEQRGNK